MALQNLEPINDQLADIIVRANEPWIETEPGKAWMKVLWAGPETGRWVALIRWCKGYVAAPHKHLSDAHTYILKGKLKVRDGVLNAGDYDYEPNGVLHGATEALEDTEYLFVCEGPVLFYDENGLTNYLGWEELLRLRDAARSGATPSLNISAAG
ncbi:MAG: cupin domain-containing protein [Pseudomonadales bacterium]